MRNTAVRGKSGSRRFASVDSVSAPRSAFNRSRGHKTTFDGGYLIPICVDEMLPGDTIKVKTESFVRMLTPLYPVMDQMWIDTQWFFAPNRLLYDNWHKLMGEQDDPGDSIDFTVPIIDFTTLPSNQFAEGTIYDYFGLPPYVDFSETTRNPISALPFRAYNLAYQQWYRPEELVNSPPINKGAGPDDATDYTLLKRAKRHDYFTSALPNAQRGTAVSLPLGTTAPIQGTITGGGTPIFQATTFSGSDTSGGLEVGATGTSQSVDFAGNFGGSPLPDTLDWNDPALDATGLTANLANATAATINAIREAVTLQQFQERETRGGSRYTEIIQSFFGVSSPDQRLQRVEYLGGASHPLNVHPLAVTAQRYAGTEVYPGDLTGFVTGGGGDRPFTYSATEHGIIFCLASVRANLTYQQGYNRMWNRQTRYDFAFPMFAMLGEQEVKNREIYADGSTNDNSTFGYQERYAEYRYAENRLSGLYRSAAPQSLDAWHLAQDFSSLPGLNQAFIEEDPPFSRVVQVQDEPMFKGDFWFNITHVRPLPVRSVPGLTRF